MALQFDLAVLVLLAAFAHAAWNALLNERRPALTFTVLRAVALVGAAVAVFVPVPPRPPGRI